jgi:hypothetical protein
MKHVDIIIIGSGMSGLYSAYKIKEYSPTTSFLILEKYKKNWIGGRTSNELFYGTEIVTGAGVGRKSKDKLLYHLLKQMHLKTYEYTVNPQIIPSSYSLDVNKTMNQLKRAYKTSKDKHKTFKQFAMNILGEKEYNSFIISTGYTDYEQEDVYETLYHYGMDDNTCCWKAFHVPWQKLVLKLYQHIGEKHFRFSNKVIGIHKSNETTSNFIVDIENGTQYSCNKVIVASTIDTIRKLLPSYHIYNDIEGQPFLRLYAKISKSSIPILKHYIKGIMYVPGPLQRIMPMDQDNGVYMIAYNDNQNAIALKGNLANTKENRDLYEVLLEKTFGMPENSLHIIAIKDFYWPIGTHFYKSLNKSVYSSREEFIDKAQHPEQGILVVGECVSRNQGWTAGALESVNAVVTKQWVTK